MTPEQKREQMLKRVLPALFITVIYFVFVSNFMEKEKEKAEKNYITLAQKGLSQAAVDAKGVQIQRMQAKLSTLKDKKNRLQSKIQSLAGFMVGESKSAETATQISKILSDHQVIVIQDSIKTVEVSQQSKSIQEIKSWLQPGKTLSVEQMDLRGDYLSMYRALKTLKEKQLAMLPVSFSMQALDEDGSLKWQLALWI